MGPNNRRGALSNGRYQLANILRVDANGKHGGRIDPQSRMDLSQVHVSPVQVLPYDMLAGRGMGLCRQP